MAILRFNSNTLHLDILIGIKEKFEPKESILEANKKAEELKNKINTFLQSTFNTTDVKEVNKIMNTDKELEDKWKIFLSSVYKPELENINNQVKEINKEICLNYSDITE